MTGTAAYRSRAPRQTLGGPVCSFAGAGRLADAASPELWPAVTKGDVDRLRDVGSDDGQIHAATTFVPRSGRRSRPSTTPGHPARPGTGRAGARDGAFSGEELNPPRELAETPLLTRSAVQLKHHRVHTK